MVSIQTRAFTVRVARGQCPYIDPPRT